MALNYAVEYPKLQARNRELQAEVERLRADHCGSSGAAEYWHRHWNAERKRAETAESELHDLRERVEGRIREWDNEAADCDTTGYGGGARDAYHQCAQDIEGDLEATLNGAG